jgi:Concanavalin A-like lectin/glucanases superfamily
MASATTISAWHMDEASGSTMIDSIGGNHGTLHNVGLGQPGTSGLAYQFNGSSSVVTVPNSASLNPGASPFWFSVQVKFTKTPTASIGGDYDLMRKGLSGTKGGFYKMELLPSGGGVRLHCSMEGSTTSHSITAGPDLRDGQWHTVQCLKDDTSISAVVDGQKTSDPIKLGSFGNTATFAVGAKAEGGDWTDGFLDEARFGTGLPGDPPTNAAPPVINGTPAVGSPLTASTGSWNGTPPIAYGYQWLSCDAAGAQCVNLAATQATYTPVLTDQGRRLQAVVTAANGDGSSQAASALTGAVVGPPLPVAASSAARNSAVITVGGSCLRVTPGKVLRKARLVGRSKLTLQFDARTRIVRLRAPHGKVRSMVVTFDGKRVSRARGGSLKVLLNSKKLAAGKHVLRATVHQRHGKSFTLTVHVTSTSC